MVLGKLLKGGSLVLAGALVGGYGTNDCQL